MSMLFHDEKEKAGGCHSENYIDKNKVLCNNGTIL
jgi:hypothetical protein